MPYRIIVGDVEYLQDYLNSALVLGPFLKSGLAVGGLTLIFNAPAATVTFSGSLGAILSMSDIVSEINAQVAGLASIRSYPQSGAGVPNPNVNPYMRLFFQRDAGFTLDAAGTANAFFGFSTSVDTVNTGAINSTKLVSIGQGSVQGMLIAVTAP